MEFVKVLMILFCSMFYVFIVMCLGVAISDEDYIDSAKGKAYVLGVLILIAIVQAYYWYRGGF